jgi:hypothetical protein
MKNENEQKDYYEIPEQEETTVFDKIVDVVMPTLIVIGLMIIVYNVIKY